ncbi:hypothetical protein CPB86DRAFT_784988 [Serendipita vermifera]|nr:hypothetical protein CPB86DRAFT_784988 [Serendipita vermifera]
MKLSTSSFVLASLAISGTSLAAPTPPMPFDSPVPPSPNPDEWLDVRSPRIPRSPMLPAIRIAGQRRAMPRSKRQEGSDQQGNTPDADTASASGLLGGLGDALSGVLHQVDDIAKGLPIIGGLGILSDSGDGNPDASSSDSSTVQKRDVPPTTPTPPTPPAIQPDQLDSIRQAVATLLLQQQQYDQAMGALTAANGGLPVDPVALQHRLQALQSSQPPANQLGSAPNLASVAGIPGVLGGLPVAGPLLSNTLGGNSGLLSAISGITNGLPVVNGLLGSGGLVNGVVGGVGSTVGSVLGGVTQAGEGILDGILGGVTGGNGQPSILNNVLGTPLGLVQGAGAPSSPHWPAPDGLYPHSTPGAIPSAPPNTPFQNPAAFAFSSLAVDGAPDGSPLPAVPPPSPANSASSVPMGHDSPDPSSMSASPSAPSEAASEAAPATTGTSSKHARRGDDSGPDEDATSPDAPEGFTPSEPDPSYVPPLMSSAKRSASMGPLESDLNEGENNKTPGSQKVLKRLIGSFPKRMLRKHVRGVSVSF